MLRGEMGSILALSYWFWSRVTVKTTVCYVASAHRGGPCGGIISSSSHQTPLQTFPRNTRMCVRKQNPGPENFMRTFSRQSFLFYF